MEAIRILIVKKRSLQSLSCENYFLLRTSEDANLCKCQSSFFEKITSVNHLCWCVTKKYRFRYFHGLHTLFHFKFVHCAQKIIANAT